MFATSSALSGSAALLLLIVCRLTLAAVTNRTIDDEYGDSVTGRRPIYDGPWNYGPACPGCFVQPSPKDVFMSSWHDTTTSLQNDHQTISLLFNGTAVWVYCVVPNYVQSATTFVNISFNLDGAPVGTYMHQPDESSDVYSYNVTVYSNTDLANTQHTLVMWAVQGSGPSLLLFDWAEYTFDDGNAESSSTTVTVIEGSLPSILTSSRLLSSTAALSSTGSSSACISTPLFSSTGYRPSSSSSGAQSSASKSIASSSYSQSESKAEYRSRMILIGCLVGGLGAGAIVLLTITLALRRHCRRNTAQNPLGNNRYPRDSWAPTIEPFMERPPASQWTSSPASMQAMTHRRSTSESITTTLHGTSLGWPVVGSAAAPATIGATVSEIVRPDARRGAQEQERLARMTRKLREQLARDR